MGLKAESAQLAEEFASIQKILVALGDENRQHPLAQMIRHADARGMRVAKVAAEV